MVTLDITEISMQINFNKWKVPTDVLHEGLESARVAADLRERCRYNTDTMEREISNVFVSQVPIKQFESDHLYELLDTQTTLPIQQEKNVFECINTATRTSDKMYISRNICKRKVRTVRQIRMQYEQFVLDYLPNDLEMQHKYLLEKICCGSSKEERIIEKAQKLFKSRSAMRRSSWQMLMNINANDVAHPMQYVIWKGRPIKLSGSKGGTKKILYNLDLSTKSKGMKPKHISKNGLLKTSLEVTFKPGPLTKKESLDSSFQKYTLGKTELKPLPRAGLEIVTTCGVPLPSYLMSFLQNRRDNDGILTKEWIDFAVCSLENNNCENMVTFHLPYKNNQKRILVRDNNAEEIKPFESQTSHSDNITEEVKNFETQTSQIPKSVEIESEIKCILDDLVTAVEVNGIQDTLFLKDDLGVHNFIEEKNKCHLRGKPEKNLELKKLDVTIIHVDGNSPIANDVACSKQCCVLGCVCQSLQCNMQLKSHCGRLECIFDCKCDFNKYCVNNNYFKGCIPGLINLDKNNGNLAKEEQKFHQTVVFTEGKSIVLSSKRRNPRMTKKYSDYLTSLSGKPQDLTKQLLISITRLQCSNIETWCMVHELYRCFCRGKYLTNLRGSESSIDDDLLTISEKASVVDDTYEFSSIMSKDVDEIIDVVSGDVPSLINSEINSYYDENLPMVHHHVNQHKNWQPTECISNVACARTSPYSGKIKQTANISSDDVETQNDENVRKNISCKTTNESPAQTKEIVFGLWLERHYKLLKERMASGLPIILLKPTPKRVSLFPWVELLKRYQLKSNYFLVNRTVPHRVFISVNPSHREFVNCMNLSDVTVNDLSKYPEFVRHFVMNTDLKDNFALLRGSSNYWEVLGIVAKNSNISITPLQTPIDAVITPPKSNITGSPRLELDPLSEPMLSAEHYLDLESCEKTLTKMPATHTGVSAMSDDLLEPMKNKPKSSIRIKKKRNRQAAMRVQKKNNNKSVRSKMINNDKIQRSIPRIDFKARSLKSSSPHKKQNSLIPRNSKQTDSSQGEHGISHNKVVKERSVSASKRKQSFCTSDSKKPKHILEEKNTVDLHNNYRKKEKHSKSRWFVMTVENDFMHLKFYKRKLFVKLTTIASAIDLARASGQTVILPLSKINRDDRNDVQFGIYATPVTDKACVLIGPYENNEDLGIETVKGPDCTLSCKKTRGVWLVTKKIDNTNVLENPLSYLSQCSDNVIQIIKGNIDHSCDSKLGEQVQDVEEKIVKNTILKNIAEILNIEKTFLNSDQTAPIENRTVPKNMGTESTEEFLEKVLNKNERDTFTNKPDEIKNTFLLETDYRNDFSEIIQNSRTRTVMPVTKVNSHVSVDAERDEPQNSSNIYETNPTNFVNHGGVLLETNAVKPATAKNIKVVKPICIKRNNSFYKFNSNSLLKPFSFHEPFDGNTILEPSTSGQIQYPPGFQCLPVITNVGSLAPISSLKVSPIKPNKKKTSEDSGLDNKNKNKTSAGLAKLFTILKPEQINNKALQYESNESINVDNEEEHLIEDELTDANSSDSSEVYVLSDDELSDVQPITTTENFKTEVLIECINVKQLGCLCGRRNSEGKISFQFPGFKFSEYYSEGEASTKINQVLARKVFVPRSLKLEWRVAHPSSGPHTLMDSSQLGTHLIMTNTGLKRASTNPEQKTLALNPDREIIEPEESDGGSVT